MENKKIITRELKPVNGFLMMILGIALLIASIALFVVSIVVIASNGDEFGALQVISIIVPVVLSITSVILLVGLKIVRPNEAYVFLLFGNYYGTLSRAGFWWVNPFVSACTGTANEAAAAQATNEMVTNAAMGKSTSTATSALTRKTISLKVQTFANGIQKVNDKMGNPIMVGAVVVWKISDPTKAVFEVDNYRTYLNNQADSIIRNVTRNYPYDSMSDGDDTNDEDEVTLRGSSALVAEQMKAELQGKVVDAGIEIIDVRINQLAYSEEIASAMLQRQQASAIIAARKKIVEGAVSMVEMALEQLKTDGVVDLDEERKAQMVSNLLVVLCGNKDAQPVVNSGSVY